MKNLIGSEQIIEKAVLVGVDFDSGKTYQLKLEDSLAELEQLAETAGVEVVGTLTQKLESPHPRTFIGTGKVEELEMLASELDATMVLFDDELSPRHQRELEEALENRFKVIDRTALILDIFAQHAETKEGQLQVELAQLKYRLPRLTRAWTHLARQTGGGAGRSGSVGGVGLRGPGETQLEVDRREIRKKIAKLEEAIDKIGETRAQHRNQRKKAHIPVVALVGYTNAGKSSLLNRLAGTGIYAADQLFATLDPTTRQVELPDGQLVLLTDTVGFIQKLPTQLVAAFRATLEEIRDADLLLHVVDASNPAWFFRKMTVLETLKTIEADEVPIVTVYNKSDLLDEEQIRERKAVHEPASVLVSCKSGDSIEDLLGVIVNELRRNYDRVKVLIPYNQGRLVSLFHEKGNIIQVTNLEFGVQIEGYLPRQLTPVYQKFLK